MKNEKMKRVAALALAGTMMASVVSPAAFATDDDSVPPTEGLVPPATNEEETTAPATAPATVESAHEVDKGEMPVAPGGLMNEIGSEIQEKVEESGIGEEVTQEDKGEMSDAMQEAGNAVQDNTHIVAVNPTIPVDGGNVPLPGESGIAIGSEGLIMTPVEESDTENPPEIEEEVPVDTDGVLGVYEVDEMLDGMQEAVDQVDDDNPLKAPVEEALEDLEGDLPDVIIGETPRPEMKPMDGQEDETPATPVTPPEDFGTHGIEPGIIEPDPVVTDRGDLNNEDEDKDLSTAQGIEATLEEDYTDEDGLTAFDKLQQAVADGGSNSIQIGEKTYDISDFTIVGKDDQSDGWVTDDSDDEDVTVQHRDYTFSLSSKDADDWDQNPLQPSEVAELLGIEVDGEAGEDEAGNVTFKGTDGNLYTITKNLGTDSLNQVTSVSWQVKVTETKKTVTGEVAVKDEIEVTEGPTVTGEPAISEEDQGQPVLSYNESAGSLDDLTGQDQTMEDLLKDLMKIDPEEDTPTNINGFTVTKTKNRVPGAGGGSYIYTLTNESGVTYTITTMYKKGEDEATGEKAQIDINDPTLTEEKIESLLNQDGETKYTVETAEDGTRKVFYTDEEGVKHELTFIHDEEEGEIQGTFDGENGKVTVSGEDDIKVQDSVLQTELEKAADQAAAEAALKKLLVVDSLPEDVKLEPVYDENDKPVENQWKAVVEGKTYTFTTVSDAGSDLLDSAEGANDGKLDGVTPGGGDVTVTVTGEAEVTSGTITWGGSYEQYGNNCDRVEYQQLAGQIGQDGKLQLDNGAALPAAGETTTYELGQEDAPRFDDKQVLSVTVDADGRITRLVTAESRQTGGICGDKTETTTKTYVFTYAELSDEELKNLVLTDAEKNNDKIESTTFDAEKTNVTKFTWNISTVTQTTEQVSVCNSTTVTGDIKEDNGWFNLNPDGDLYVEFEGEGYCDPDDKVVIEETSNGSWTAEGKDKDAEYTATAEDMTIEEVEAMLKEQGKTDVVVTQNTETGKFEVTYKKDGNTYSATYDAKDVTVEKKEDIQLSGKDDCYNSIYQALEQAYGQPGSGNGSYQIEEYETFLNGAEDSEENRKAFVDSLAKSEDMTTTTTTEKLTGSKLESVVSSLNHGKAAVGKYTNEFNLQSQGTAGSGKDKINFVIINGDVDWGAKDPTVEYGTASAVTNNVGQVNKFDIEDEITTESSESSKITNSKYEQDDPNWCGGKNYNDWRKDDSYYHVTGTAAYTSPDNAKYFDDLNKDLNGKNAKGTLAQVKAEYPDAVLVKYENEHGKDVYRIYETTTSLDAYGYLDNRSSTSDGNTGPNSNPCGGGNVYNLRLDQNLELTDKGIVTTGTYETKTSWSATLTMVQKKEGSVLTVDSLYKTTTNSSCNVEGNRTAGDYAVIQEIKTKNNIGNAIYHAEEKETYTLSQDYLATTASWEAEANHYGHMGRGGEGEALVLNHSYTDTTVDAQVLSKTEQTIRAVYAELNRTPAPTENPDGPGTGGEETPETPETPEQPEDPILILTDVPTEEEAEIVETETPLAAAPAEEEAVIEDEDVALSGAPETEEAEIADEDVAKSAVPKTGDESGIFLLMSMISGMALAALSFIDRKGRHSRFGSRH